MIRAVIDTNILVRAVIKPEGTVGPVLDRLEEGQFVILFNEATLEELVDVLGRPRLRRSFSITDQDVQTVLDLVALRGEAVEPVWQQEVCRDPKDDKFLGLAVDGHADVIVSTDEDLVVLDPFEGIPIVGAARFLEMLG